MNDAPRRRRPRYPGTHPRRFEERYKERGASPDPDTVAKVLASGRTPAGSHRPILVAEILEVLAPKPGERAIDATLGAGGHAEAILPLLRPGGTLLGTDVDPVELPRTEERLRAAGFGPDELVIRRRNFAGLPALLGELGWDDGADLLLADLGVSSMQLDDPARGFSWKREAPLDLRMNPTRGQGAAKLLASIREEELARLLAENSDEPHAAAIAREVVRAREADGMETTTQLAEAIRRALATLSPRDRAEAGDRPLARVFQALRMEVNDEAGALATLLGSLPRLLRPGGRVAILAFHSGEDRRVKRAFAVGKADGTWSAVADGPIRPSAAERGANPRSAPAKLRWAVRGR